VTFHASEDIELICDVSTNYRQILSLKIHLIVKLRPDPTLLTTHKYSQLLSIFNTFASAQISDISGW